MKPSIRIYAFLIGAAGFACIYAVAIIRLPPAERHFSVYGQALNQQCVEQRHVTDVITAVNFDYRGFDTVGEEFIMFISVLGSLVLLRETEPLAGPLPAEGINPRRATPASEAMGAWTLALTGPTVLMGIYIVIHGQLTPGGGFQGGVILATAPLMIFLAEDLEAFRRVTSFHLLEIVEAVGAGGFVLIGATAWLGGREFLSNVWPLGTPGTLRSGGTIFGIDLVVGLEVSAGFVLLLYAFLQASLVSGKEK